MTVEDLIKRKTELGYTNEMIAAKSGVPLGTVQKIFSGKTERPRYNTLQSLQCVLYPEDHSPKEAALYKEMEENRYLDYAGRVEESNAFGEYSAETQREEHRNFYERAVSWKKPGEYTVEDLHNMPDGTRVELIDGVIYDRNAPSKRHQFIVGKLFAGLDSAIEEKGDGHCLVLTAPTGVQLSKDDNKNMLEPDVFIVCDREKYSGEEEDIIGAPDFVAEVLSPSTEKYDRIKKLNKYWKAGVREYWLINIEDEEIMVYIFGKKATLELYSFEDRVPLGISGGKIVIDFRAITDRMRLYFG